MTRAFVKPPQDHETQVISPSPSVPWTPRTIMGFIVGAERASPGKWWSFEVSTVTNAQSVAQRLRDEYALEATSTSSTVHVRNP